MHFGTWPDIQRHQEKLEQLRLAWKMNSSSNPRGETISFPWRLERDAKSEKPITEKRLFASLIYFDNREL